MASVQNYTDSLKTHSELILHTLTTNWWLVRGLPQGSDTKQPMTGILSPPDIPLAQTRLSPPLFPHSPPTPPVLPFHDYCALLFRHPHITQNKWVLYFPLSPPPPPPPPPFSHFLSLPFSPLLGADERQALSRQWHSKTSGLGSSVSGYSTLLGAISLSKV